MTNNNLPNKPAASPVRQLIAALAPLAVALFLSGGLAFYSDKLVYFFFGDDPKKAQGYFMLILILLPFVAVAVYSEWSLNRVMHKDTQD